MPFNSLISWYNCISIDEIQDFSYILSELCDSRNFILVSSYLGFENLGSGSILLKQEHSDNLLNTSYNNFKVNNLCKFTRNIHTFLIKL